MPICNRDLDATQQRETFNESVSTVTGQTYALAIIPYPATLIAIEETNIGLSGSPNHSIWLQRFIVGSGTTSIAIGASIVPITWATSGPIGYTFNGANVTFPLQAGDMIALSTAAANTATVSTTVSIVVKALQDYKSHFGL